MNAPTRPSLMTHLHTAMDEPSARPWLTRWTVLALIVLGTAGLFALPLAFGRAPGISDYFPWFVTNFRRFLVVHVDYSFVVFFLTLFAIVAHISAYRLSNGQPRFLMLEYLAFRATVVAVAGMFIPVFIVPEGTPVMSNYVPVITSPLFYLSLVVLASAMALMAAFVLLSLFSGKQKNIDTLSLVGIAGSMIYLLAFAYFLYAWAVLNGQRIPGLEPSQQFNEELFWAGGHMLQFLNVTLLIGTWYTVASALLGRAPFNPKIIVVGLGLVVLAAFATPLFFTFYEIFSARWMMAFTTMQYAFAPVALIVALPLLKVVLGHPDKPWKNPAYVALLLSPVVFGIGGIMGLFVDGQDTRTPGHYHAMIAGVTLAFMALFYAVILPLLKRRITYPRLSLASVWLFGVGQALASTGLFLAGGQGIARKTAGAEQDLNAFTAKLGMGLNGGAGLLAIIGGAFFVWVCAAALLNHKNDI